MEVSKYNRIEDSVYNKIVKIGIEVDDMEKSLEFYCHKCGMRLLERFPQKDGGECVFLDAKTVILELMTPKTSGEHLHHIALGVDDDMDGAVNFFRRLGVKTAMDHKVVEGNIHLADINDPDGMRVRLFKRDK